MTNTASGLVLGLLLSTAYGAAFHLIMGGRPRNIIIYVVASWLGFTIGHFVGDFLGIDTLKLGAIHLLTASLGNWVLLLGMWLLYGQSR